MAAGAKQAQAPAAKTGDSFQNLLTRTGMGAGSVQDGSGYGFNPITRNRVQLQWAYRSSWIVGQVVDVWAKDMTREGVDIKGQIEPDDSDALHKAAKRLRIWDSLREAIQWSRLYGGAIAVLLIDGQKLDTPLRLDTVGPGQFRGVMVLDRWMVQPSLEDLIDEMGPDMGLPRFYSTFSKQPGVPNMKIHYSRCIRLEGVPLPYYERLTENLWGLSVVERMWDRLVPFDSATEGAAQLVYKAHLRTYKVKGLREIISIGGKAFEGLVKQIDTVRQFQSNEGLTLMDAEDEFEAHSYAFSGLDSVLLQMGQQISGATGIPLVRLFGQSPAGLSATGESDIRNYYDNISQDQEARLQGGVGKIYEALYRSEIDGDPPDDFDIEFRPLWQMSATEKATNAQTTATAVIGAYEAGVISLATAVKELRQSSRETGVFTNITDEDITEAEAAPPPGAAALQGFENANSEPDAGQKAEPAGEKDIS